MSPPTDYEGVGDDRDSKWTDIHIIFSRFTAILIRFQTYKRHYSDIYLLALYGESYILFK